MPKRYSSQEIQKVLERLGYRIARQKGSHMIFKNVQGGLVVIVANKKEVPPGTFSKILRDIQISKEKFELVFKGL